MRHILICPTWRCQNHCRYCWMDYTVRAREGLIGAAERPAADWIAAINREPLFVDIAGGEPLLYRGLVDIIAGCQHTNFGLSTNGMWFPGVKRLCDTRLPNLGSINMSIHTDCGLEDYEGRFKAAFSTFKQAGYPVFASIVLYEDELRRASALAGWVRRQGGHVDESPYEDMRPEALKQAVPLECDAGRSGFVVAPDGQAWPCLGALWSERWQDTRLGNWLDGDGLLDMARVPKPCLLYCESYYQLLGKHPDGDVWQTNVRPYEGAQ